MPPPRPTALRHNLRASVIDGTAYMVMVGLAETSFAVFVLELNLGEVAAGLVLTLPLLLAATLQLATPRLVRALGSYRTVTWISAAFQTVALIPLAIIALVGHAPTWVVFLAAGAYWSGAVVGGPSWSAWMGVIIPARVRPRFFAFRNRWLQVGVIAGLLLGGGLLHASNVLDARHFAPWRDWTLPAFAVIFLLAALARAVSAFYLWKQTEPQPLLIEERAVGFVELGSRLRHGPDGRLIAALLAVFFARQLAEPYWHPFVKAHHAFPFDQYVLLLLGGFLGKMIALPWLQDYVHAHGPRRVMKVAAVALVPISGLWLLGDSLAYLFVAQMLAGAALAAWELASFLMLYEALDARERTSIISKYTFANHLAAAGGSLLGGLILHRAGHDAGAYAVVFIASIAARLGALVLVARVRPGAPMSAASDHGPLAVLPDPGASTSVPGLPEQALDPGRGGERSPGSGRSGA